MGRTATARPAARRTARATTKPRRKLERCQHGLLRGTCAICLQMEETIDLTTGKLAPDERPPRSRASDDEGEEEEDEE